MAGGANPRCGTCTTVAPCPAAMQADASVDPLSATTGWKPSGIRVSTQGSAAASLRQGRMTSMLMVDDSNPDNGQMTLTEL